MKHSSRAHSPIHVIENDKHYLQDPSYRHHDEIIESEHDRHHSRHHHRHHRRQDSMSPQPQRVGGSNSTSRRSAAGGGLALVSNDMEDMLRNVTMQK